MVPYTAYNTKKSYLENNPDILKGFTKAINKGLDYVHSHSAEDIASVIADDFPDVSRNDLIKIINRYIDIDAWFETTTIKEEDFNHIEEIMASAKELDKKAPFDKLVDNSYGK